ncbi:MAG: phosphoglycerate kinase [bacterium]|nr:phosphoglycerate kinase [bacterium]
MKFLKSIPQKELKNKRVLLRTDFNVPIGKNGKISGNEDWRIKAALPTIKYLLKQKAKIILLSHLGRPKGKVIEKLRLDPVQNKLSRLLGISIKKTPDCIGKDVEKAVRKMKAGKILMLENLRFHEEEENNNEKFAKKLAKLGDIYINDAFSDSHRKHASIAGITKYLPSYAGLLMEKELELMSDAIRPDHPAIAIIGGAKLETKLPAVNALAKIYDHVLVGGMIANEILNTSIKNEIASNVVLPKVGSLEKQKYFDIGENAIGKFSELIQIAKFIIWNGPMGKFEENEYSQGTRGIIKAIKIAYNCGARVLIGGGETIYAVQKFAPELMDKKIKGFNISTGGGAMLDFLAGKRLPGIEALKNF